MKLRIPRINDQSNSNFHQRHHRASFYRGIYLDDDCSTKETEDSTSWPLETICRSLSHSLHTKSSTCPFLKQNPKTLNEKRNSSYKLNEIADIGPHESVKWLDQHKPIANNSKCIDTKSRKINRHYSQQDFRDIKTTRNRVVKRAASLDDIYRQCVNKIETIKSTLDQTPKQKIQTMPTNTCISPRNYVSLFVDQKDPDTSNNTILAVLLTSVTWAMSLSLTLTYKVLSILKTIVDQWLLISWTIWKSIYAQKKLCIVTSVLVIPLALLSGLAYGMLGLLLVANGVLIFCKIR